MEEYCCIIQYKIKKDNVVKILKETAKEIGMEGYTFHEIPPLSVRADAVKKFRNMTQFFWQKNIIIQNIPNLKRHCAY